MRNTLSSFCLCLVLAASSLTMGCHSSSDDAPQSGLLASIQQRGYIRVGATGDYPPLSYLNPETGEYEGFETDLDKIIAAELNVDLVFEPTTWPTINTDILDASHFDIANCGITITDKRLQTLDMSDGYISNGKTIICRKEDASRFVCLDSINQEGVRVMVNPGGLNEKFARENLTRTTILVHEHNEEIPSLVADSIADLMVCEIVEAPFYAKTLPNISAPIVDKPFTSGQIGILFRQDNDDLKAFLNDLLDRMRQDGRMDSLKALHSIP